MEVREGGREGRGGREGGDSLLRQTLGKTRVWSNLHSGLVPTC